MYIHRYAYNTYTYTYTHRFIHTDKHRDIQRHTPLTHTNTQRQTGIQIYRLVKDNKL